MIVRVPENKKIQKLQPLNEGFFDNNPQADPKFTSGALAAAKQAQKLMHQKYEETLVPEVQKFLDYFDITDTEINCTGNGIVVDVHENLHLPNKNISSFPGFRFGIVDGNCNFSGNRFTDFFSFPRKIHGSLLANFNYIKNFHGAPDYIGGNIIAYKQKVKTQYPLTKENFELYKSGKLLENRVYVISQDEYGELKNINEKENNCQVLLDNGSLITTKTNDVDCLESSIKLLL